METNDNKLKEKKFLEWIKMHELIIDDNDKNLLSALYDEYWQDTGGDNGLKTAIEQKYAKK